MAVTDRGQNEPNARGISALFRARPKAEFRNTHNLEDNMKACLRLYTALPVAASLSAASSDNGARTKGCTAS
jgi:hypothetical protein